jgi:HSP20 family protein
MSNPVQGGANTSLPTAVRNDINLLLDILENTASAPASEPNLKANMLESDTEYFIKAELPGVDIRNISVTLRGSYLIITANRVEETESYSQYYVAHEISSCSYQRCFHVENVSPQSIVARYENGMLKLHLPKNQGTQNGIRIEIK